VPLRPTRSRRIGVLLASLAAVLLVAGCTGRPGPSAVSTASSPSSPSPTSPSSSVTGAAPSAAASGAPVAAPAPAAPPRAACYRLTGRELTQPTNSSRPVPCSKPHTARTIYVGRLNTVVDGHSVAVDSTTVQQQLATTCPRKLAAYVGGSPVARDLSRLQVVWYSPTLAQSDRGAEWFRCDLIAFSRADALLTLPSAARLKGALDRRGGLDAFGLCGTAAPGTAGFERIVCAEKHAWRAIDTIPLGGAEKYPGEKAVRTRGDGPCKDAARSRVDNTLRFTYGWEWPTADQWAAGQHFGYCWAPA
jgi:Septum formation